MHEFDKLVFHWINGWSDAWRGFYVFFSEGIKTTPVRAVLAVFVLAMLAGGAKTQRAIVHALIAWPIANGCTDVLKNVFKLQRPCVDLWPDVIMRVDRLTSFGTASAHSANMAAIATVMVWRLGWWGSPWILIAFVTGLARIYVGVHYPSQVLNGWIVGVLVGAVVVKTWDAIVLRRSAVRMDSEAEPDASPEL